MEAYTEAFLNLAADDGEAPERVYGLSVTPHFFETLGVRPALGRLFVPEDAATEAGPGALILSHDLWQRRFGGAPDIVGRTLALGRVVGVLPPDFFFPSRRFELFQPIESPVFFVREDEVRVPAVAHANRRPDYWLTRIGQ
jgi:hypothetical protein